VLPPLDVEHLALDPHGLMRATYSPIWGSGGARARGARPMSRRPWRGGKLSLPAACRLEAQSQGKRSAFVLVSGWVTLSACHVGWISCLVSHQACSPRAPRGYCAGVDRAVIAVEKALELHGAPIYVRKEIVHNKYVVETLTDAGRSSWRRRTRSPWVPESCSRLTGLSPRSRGRRRALAHSASTPHAPSSPRCTRRPFASPAKTRRSC